MPLPLLVVGSEVKFETKRGWTTHILIEKVDDEIIKQKVQGFDTWTRSFSGTDERGQSQKGTQTIERLANRKQPPFFTASYSLDICYGCPNLTASTQLKY